MNEQSVNIKALCDAVLSIVPRAPITYRSENEIVFKGERLILSGKSAAGRRIYFPYTNAISMLEAFQVYGIKISDLELDKILKSYNALLMIDNHNQKPAN